MSAPEYQQPSDIISGLADYLTDVICNDERINKFAIPLARKMSKTDHWSEKEWEENEDTPAYNLYYAHLSAIHQQICAVAIIQLGYRFE